MIDKAFREDYLTFINMLIRLMVIGMTVEEFNVWTWIRECTLQIMKDIDNCLTAEDQRRKSPTEVIKVREKLQEEIEGSEMVDVHFILDILTL
jgi:hypothetical protein